MGRAGEKALTRTDKLRVGITHGDFNGIGYEIILKAFSDTRILDNIVPILYGSAKIASYHSKTIGGGHTFNQIKSLNQANIKKLNILNVINQEVRIELGHHSEQAGEAAFLALEAAVRDLRNDDLDVLITAPINKHAIQSDRFNFPGHTEYLASQFNSEDYIMLMVSDIMRLGVVTGHIPLREVASRVTPEMILKKLRVVNHSLKCDFAILKPKIAVLGLNPHAGDRGLLGDEEIHIIQPAIDTALNEGMVVFGPYPADGFFASGQFRNFDAVLAMYHDQGLVPFKALSFERGVNFTAGLPIVRTSPAHGTAFEIAGKDLASPDSIREAVYLAADIFANRREYSELTSEPLGKHLDQADSSHNHQNSKDYQREKSLPTND